MDRDQESKADGWRSGRRRFLQTGLTATVAATLPAHAIAHQVAAKPPLADDAAFELDGVGIADLEEGMRSGKWTACVLVEKYFSRIGRAWSEPTLLRLAYAFEQATHFRKPPRFRATAATS